MSRQSLIGGLRSRDDAPLVAITAPAGYGKTTLLQEWADVDDRPVVALALDAADNDPVALARSLATGFVTAGLAPKEVIDTWGPPLSPSGPSTSWLPRSLATVAAPFTLLIDDLDVLHDEAALDLIGRLSTHVPAGAQIVLAGRTRPPFLARRRASGEVIEVGPKDLAIDAGGAAAVFRAAGVEVTDANARLLADRAEGWPAGIYLSALAVRASSETASQARIGADPFVADYLLREVFEHLPADQQTFLGRAALLDEMCAPLCDHVTGEQGAQAMLRRIEESNLFVIPLDRERTWYRFHKLFRDFLLSEHAGPPSEVEAMHRRAAEWCHAHGRPEQAVEYLLRAGASDQLGPLLCEVVRPAYLEGRLSTIQRWLDACGAPTIEAFPALAVLAGWIAAMTGRPIDAERWAAVTARFTDAQPSGAGFASFASAAASLRALTCSDGPETMAADAQASVDLEPDWGLWRNTVLWLSGQAHELLGDRDRAQRCYEASRRVDLDRGTTPLLVATVSLATLAMGSDDWGTAADHLDQARGATEMVGPGTYIEGTLFHVAEARLALRDGDAARLATSLRAAMDGRHLATWAVPHGAVRIRLDLARIQLARGDRATTRGLLDEVDAILERRPEVGVLVAEHRELRDRLDATEVPLALDHGLTLTPAEVRLLPYLSTHLTFAQIAATLFLSRNTIGTQVGSIYRKLGVSSRADAVQRLQDLGFAPRAPMP